MLDVKTYLIGCAILIIGLLSSPLNAANMRGDMLGCKNIRDFDPNRRSGPDACQVLAKGTYVVVEKAASGSLCVRPLGGINCLWVYESQVMNRD
jgi:hypothetical protein